MAIYRVWSGATGAADGSTWADAYTTLKAAIDDVGSGVAADYYVHTGTTDIHYETQASNKDHNGPTGDGNVIRIIGVDKNNSDAYTISASTNIETTGTTSDIIFDGAFKIYGIQISIGDDLDIDSDLDEGCYMQDCKITIPTTGMIKSYNGKTCFKDVDFVLNGGVLYVATTTIIGGSITGTISTEPLLEGYSYSGINSALLGVDLTGISGGTLCGASGRGVIKLIGCKLPTGALTIVEAKDNHCEVILSATDADTNHNIRRLEKHTSGVGNYVLSDTVYRSSGNAEFSLSVDGGTYSGSVELLSTEWFEGEIASTGSKTFTAFIANNTADLTDKDVWLEVQYFGSATSTMMTIDNDEESDPVATAANQDDDTVETWTGATLTYKQKLVVTGTVNKVGPFRWRVHCATSDSFYLDPDLEVT